MVTTSPRRRARMWGADDPGYVHGAEQVGVELTANMRGADGLEPAELRLADIIHRYVDAAKVLDSWDDGRGCGVRVGDVQRQRHEPIACNAQCGADLVRIT